MSDHFHRAQCDIFRLLFNPINSPKPKYTQFTIISDKDQIVEAETSRCLKANSVNLNFLELTETQTAVDACAVETGQLVRLPASWNKFHNYIVSLSYMPIVTGTQSIRASVMTNLSFRGVNTETPL